MSLAVRWSTALHSIPKLTSLSPLCDEQKLYSNRDWIMFEEGAEDSSPHFLGSQRRQEMDYRNFDISTSSRIKV